LKISSLISKAPYLLEKEETGITIENPDEEAVISDSHQNLIDANPGIQSFKKYPCHKCSAIFIIRKALKKHLFHVHSEWPFNCQKCRRKFRHKEDLLKHLTNCKLGIASENRIKPMDETSEQVQENNYIANPVEKASDVPDEPAKPSDIPTISKTVLDNQNPSIQSVKRYRCDQCSAIFTLPEALKKHQSYVHSKWPFDCQKCSRKFRHKDDLLNHLSECGLKQIKPMEISSEPVEENHFATKPVKESDVVPDKPIFLQPITQSSQPFALLVKLVPIPEKTQNFPSILNTDQVNVSRNKTLKGFSCHICQKVFKARTDLRKHLRLHTEDKCAKCDICGKKFVSPSHLENHRRIHTGERPYACSDCGQGFKQKGQLKRHQFDLRIGNSRCPKIKNFNSEK